MDSYDNRRKVSEAKPAEYFSHTREEILSLVPQSARSILDVGCGAGALGLRLQDLRPDRAIDGIELVKNVAPVGKYRKVFIGNVERVMPDLARGKRRYDCVIFADVLEHLVDPWSVVAASGALVSPKGCVIASIPNIRNYSVLHGLFLKGDWTYTSEGLLDKTHLRFFTLGSIRTMFENSGFVIDRVNTVRYPPSRGLNKIVHTILSRTKRFSGLDVFQYLVVARRANAGGK